MCNGNIFNRSLMGIMISMALYSLLCHEVNGAKVISRQANRVIQGQTETVAQEMQERILSKDFDTAKKALDDNRWQRRVIAIRMSLKSQFLVIRQGAADAIRELQDKSSVPALIEALENNQVRYSGGLEIQSKQAELNKSLLSALQTLTGLNLPEGHELSPAQAALQPLTDKITEGHELSDAQIKEAIQEYKRWWNENKDKIK
jgi:hypothetical protein